MNPIQLEQATVVRNGVAIVDGVSIQLQPGEVLGLIGPNGAGKSTLMRAMLGLVQLDGGDCRLQGEPLGRWSMRERARLMAYLPQNTEAHWPLLAARVVAMGRLPHLSFWQRPGAKDQQAIDRAVELAEVEDLLDRVVTTLSGGERMRVNLARLLATGAPTLLADEPIASLDPYHQFHIMEIFAEHARGGGSVMVVLHDLNYAARFCDRLLLMDRGRSVIQGTPCEVLQPEILRRTYGIDARWIESDGVTLLAPLGRHRSHH